MKKCAPRMRIAQQTKNAKKGAGKATKIRENFVEKRASKNAVFPCIYAVFVV